MTARSACFPDPLTAAAALVLVTGAAPRVSAQRTAVVTAAVRHAATGAPVVNATVRALPAGRSCVTAGNGSCHLVVAAGRLELRATALGFAPSNQSIELDAAMQAGVSFLLTPAAVPLEQLVTVGTRAPARTVSRSPVPVDVLSNQLLDETGLPESWQQLQRLVPSLNVPHIPVGDNHMRPVTLRGLAPHHVLVLVNGKRRHPAAALLAGPQVPFTAMTDIGTIPTTAIERIEVLRDGAAAQYGSDAIGGVVNVVLRTGERRELRATAGTAFSSEGGRDFRDGRRAGAAGTWGIATSGGGHLTLSAELRQRGGTNRAYPDSRQQYFTGDPRNDEPPRISSHLGDGSVREGVLLLSAAVPAGRGAEAYAFGGVARRDGRSPDAFFRRPLEPTVVRAIHPDGFLPEVGSAIHDLSATAGVRGHVRGWRWDVSSVWGRNRVAYTVRNSNNPSLGASSPTRFDAGTVAAQQWTSNGDVSRALWIGSLPANVASGIEHRVERYEIGAGAPDSWRDGAVPVLDGPARGSPAAVGAQGLPGLRPTDALTARRSSSAAYLELELRPREPLLLQLAGRAEHYSDFGSTANGKLATRIVVGRGVSLRGSVSTGFRAPALAQQYFSSTRTIFRPVDGVTEVLTVRTFPVTTAEARAMGATPLRPERSVNRSTGILFERPGWPLVALDLYRVDITDRIGLGGSITDTAIVRMLEEKGLRGIAGGNYFTNKTDTRTRGADLVASHIVLIGRARTLRLLAGVNLNRTLVTRVAPPPPQLERFEAFLFNRTARGVIEHGQPRRTFTLTGTYTTRRLALTLHNQRSGPTAQLDQRLAEADQVVRPTWITDGRVSWQLRRRLQVSVSGANVFDRYPDESRGFKGGARGDGPSIQGISRYPGALSPFGMNGREIYLQVDWR